jgi:amino acid adenylation domain-containing protein
MAQLPVESVEGFRLSPQQRRLWRMMERHPRISFAAQVRVVISGPLDSDRLDSAVLTVRRSHEILRTRFVSLPGAGIPVQVINDEMSGLGQRLNLANSNPASAGLELESIAAALWNKAGTTDGTHGVNFTLVRLQETEHVLLITACGLCADAMALGVIIRHLRDEYEGSSSNQNELIQYADIAEWQNQLLENEGKDHDSYWNTADFAELRFPSLPFELRNSGIAEFDPGVLVKDVSVNVSHCLKSLDLQSENAAEAFLVAAYQVLLSRYASTSEFLLGVTVDGRTPAELCDAVGLFAKSMPVAAAVGPQQSFLDLVRNVSRTLELATYDQPFFDAENFVSGTSSRRPLPLVFKTSHVVVLEPTESTEWEIRSSAERLEPFDLSVTATIADSGLKTLKFAWDKSVFAEREIAMLAGFYAELLQQVVADPQRLVSELRLDSAVVPPTLDVSLENAPNGVLEWIEEQCASVPQNMAVICGHEQLTYAGLNQRASQLTLQLLAEGAGADSVIGILAPRSTDFIVAIFAVLKAGAALLPIDPDTPLERIQYMLGRAAATILIAEGKVNAALQEIQIPIIRMDELEATDIELTVPRPNILPEQLAYVIFTSGSTGKPKGVAIEHRQLIAYLRGFRAELNLPDGASYALVSTMAADLGHTPVFAALTSGGCIHVIPPACSGDMPTLAQCFIEHPVDCIKIVPAHLEALCQAFSESTHLPWKAAILGGEPLTWELTETIRKFAPDCKVVNEYGPTETTVGVISGSAEPAREEFKTAEAPIGSPRSGVAAYVLDESLRPVPAWVTGDLYIGGSSVGRGYIGTPDLTAERFIPDPFHQTPGSRMYVTGDRARYRSDGTFEFLGRRDGQIKLRGYRIELGEIEANLCRHPQVQGAVVTLLEDKNGEKALAAWVAVGQATVQLQEMRRFAMESLPGYMVPSFFTFVDRLKLNANGKVDRQALPPVAEQQTSKGSMPVDEVEESLLGALRKVLGKQNISVDDNYFSMGGDSLRVVQVVHEARRYGIAIRAMDILRHQTIRNLRKALQQERRSELLADGLPQIVPVTPQSGLLPPDAVDWYEISEIQSFVLEKYAANRGAEGIYHIQECFHLEDPTFSQQALETAFKTVVDRHPALRTVFYLKSSPPLQCVRHGLSWKVNVRNITDLDSSTQDVIIADEMRADRADLFNPGNPEEPLFRVVLFLRSSTRFSLMFSCHHAIMDGWGHRTFLNQLMDTYTQVKAGGSHNLGEPDNTYHQFVAFEKAICQSGQAKQFWRSYLSGAQFPSFPRFAAEPVAETDERIVGTQFAPEQTQALQCIAQENAVSMQALLLAGWLEALRQWSGEPLVSTGVISNGRSEYLSDPLSAVGLFWNIVPVISRDALPLLQQAAVVQKDLIAIQPHSSYSLPRLLSENSGRELFYSAFKYLNFWNTKAIPQESELHFVDACAIDRYPFALSCSAVLDYSILHIEVEFDPKATVTAPAKKLLDLYKRIVEELAAKPELLIENVSHSS